MRARWRWPSPVVPRVASFRVFCSSGRDACHAGTTPNSSPVITDSPTANASAWPSTAIGATRESRPARARGSGPRPRTRAAPRSAPPTHRQQHALGEQLANQHLPAGAERGADRQLAGRARWRAPSAGWRRWRRRSAARSSTAPSSTSSGVRAERTSTSCSGRRDRREVRVGVGIRARQLLPDRVELGVRRPRAMTPASTARRRADSACLDSRADRRRRPGGRS